MFRWLFDLFRGSSTSNATEVANFPAERYIGTACYDYDPGEDIECDSGVHAAFNLMEEAIDEDLQTYIGDTPFDNDFWTPSINIDGNPMIGAVDIHGHPYGITDTFESTFQSSDTFASDSFCDELFSNDNLGTTDD